MKVNKPARGGKK